MSKVTAYSSSGSKSTSAVTLPKEVFAEEVKSHRLLQEAYRAYLAAGRSAGAKTLTRGLVRGGGRKPWRQKGTGRARVGSIRSPIWRSGGITFGPTGHENYTIKLSTKTKRKAIRQALSLKATAGNIKVIESFKTDGKVKPTVALLKKIDATRRILMVVEEKNIQVERATRNIPNLKTVQAKYLNVFDLLNADTIVISKKSLEIIKDWLAGQAK